MPRSPRDRSLPTGKLPASLLAELLARHASPAPEVLLGPSVGEDACAIQVEAGTLVAATDPITLTGSDVGAHAVLVNANDVAVMGVRPRWFLATVLLPQGTNEAQVHELFSATHDALERLGVAWVGGHTEVTPAVTQPVVVGQMLGLSADGSFVKTGGVRVGDRILQIGPAPIEGAAVLAAEAGARLGALTPEQRASARAALSEPGIVVVEPALLAAKLGAHALHDPTEGGLACGLWELAEASDLALVVDAGEMLWFDAGRAVCDALGADAWGTLASGTLLAAFPSERASAARRELSSQGHLVSEIGEARAGHGVAFRGGGELMRFERDEVARILEG